MSLVYFGPRQTINNAIFLVFALFAFRVFWAFLPFLIVLYIGRTLLGASKKNQRQKTYYYKFNQEDFDSFFRTGAGGQQGRSYSSNGSYGNYNRAQSYFEDKSKYYNLLGISQNATQDEIKKAFRAKAREYHPDKFSNATEAEKNNAEKRFKEINEAYDKLKV